MERLTDKKEADAQRRKYENRLKQGYPRNIPEERFLRLAAYEDTMLEPEEVADFDRLVKLYLEAGLDKQFVLACIEATKAGITVDRLHELAQADREGRCVVLPKDRMVYFHEESIDSGEKWVGNWPIKDILLKCGFGIASLTYSIRDVGNKIYFDRNEAQAALRREQDEA